MTFASGYSLLLNRQNFEWNKSSFSEQFKESTNAMEFISLWQEVTILDSTGKKAVPKDISTLSASSPSSQTCSVNSAGAKRSLSNSDSADLQSPAPKRAISTPVTIHSGNKAHPSVIDDAIHLKRIGKFTSGMCIKCV